MRETEKECPNCESNLSLSSENELLCTECYFAPDERVSEARSRRESLWEKHWRTRAKYDDKTGQDRKRVVGGFLGAYTYSGDEE